MTAQAENNQNNWDSNADEVEQNNVTISEEMDFESIKKQFTTEKEKAEKYLANWQRAEADFSNYKKRAEQEKNDLINFSNSNLIFNLLPVIDDIDRALTSIPTQLEKLSWIDGIRLIHSKLLALMKSAGLTEIEALNQSFDPNFHEAVAHTAGDDGKVIEIVQKGYKLKDRILRPAMVVVGKGKTEPTMEEKPS